MDIIAEIQKPGLARSALLGTGVFAATTVAAKVAGASKKGAVGAGAVVGLTGFALAMLPYAPQPELKEGDWKGYLERWLVEGKGYITQVKVDARGGYLVWSDGTGKAGIASLKDGLDLVLLPTLSSPWLVDTWNSSNVTSARRYQLVPDMWYEPLSDTYTSGFHIIKDGALLATYKLSRTGQYTAYDISPDGRYVAIGTAEGLIMLFEAY